MFKSQLPASGPLSTPLIRSYLRRTLISIRHHYKSMYFRCNGAICDGVLSYCAVTTLLKRSGSNLTTFNVFSYIVSSTDTGKHSTPSLRLNNYFSGVVPKYTLYNIIRYLKRINYIKQYRYNPDDPTGPARHYTLTPQGKEYYDLFIKALEHHFLYIYESDDMPGVNKVTKTTTRLPRLDHNLPAKSPF